MNLPRVSVHIGYTRVFVYVIYVLLLLRVKTLDGVDILLAIRLCPAPQLLVQHIQEIEKVYRGLDGMSLIDLEVLVQAQIESTVEAIYATVTLGNLPIVFTDIIFYALLRFRVVQDRLVPSRRY